MNTGSIVPRKEGMKSKEYIHTKNKYISSPVIIK